MISKGIVINWSGGREYIQIDVDKINLSTCVTRTLEYWISEKRFVSYETSSTIRKEGDTHIITIDYKQERNKHIPKEMVWWGQADVHLITGKVAGIVRWRDDRFPANNDGEINWHSIGDDLYKEPTREIVSRIKRNQKALRQALIATGACCAITGETTQEALDVAHIIASAESGADVIDNSILLRTDIHRLFDKKMFSISSSGEITNISEKLSSEYKELLKTKSKLERDAFERVKIAIETVLLIRKK